jgi:hypothetical protein
VCAWDWRLARLNVVCAAPGSALFFPRAMDPHDAVDDDEFAHLLADDDDDVPASSAKRLAKMVAGTDAEIERVDVGHSSLGGDGLERSLREEVLAGAFSRQAGPSLTAAERSEIKRTLDEADAGGSSAALDEAMTKRLCSALRKAHEANSVARAKHEGAPQLFQSSEEELHDAVREIQNVASAPPLLPTFVASGGAETLLAVMAHPNVDIACAALEFFEEALDSENSAGGKEGRNITELARVLVRLGGVEAIARSLWEFGSAQGASEEDAQRTVQCALSLCESLFTVLADDELDPFARFKDTQFLEFLCRRTLAVSHATDEEAVEAFLSDTARHQCASFLGFLVQTRQDARRLILHLRVAPTHPALPSDGLAPVDGLEVLLRAVAPFRLTDYNPRSPEERECCEALFDCLTSLVAEEPEISRKGMERSEGIDLLVMMARTPKLYCRHCAVVSLSKVLSGWDKGLLAALDAGLLGAIAPVFMGRFQDHTRHLAGQDAADAEMESSILLMGQVIRVAHQRTDDPMMKLRVVGKLLEEDGSKIMRLVDLHKDLAHRVDSSFGVAALAEAEAMGADETEARLLARMDAGLFALQCVDESLARASQLDPRVHSRALSRLAMVRVHAGALADTLEEAALMREDDNQGSTKGELEALAQQLRLLEGES